jgi:hypothetical protein
MSRIRLWLKAEVRTGPRPAHQQLYYEWRGCQTVAFRNSRHDAARLAGNGHQCAFLDWGCAVSEIVVMCRQEVGVMRVAVAVLVAALSLAPAARAEPNCAPYALALFDARQHFASLEKASIAPGVYQALPMFVDLPTCAVIAKTDFEYLCYRFEPSKEAAQTDVRATLADIVTCLPGWREMPLVPSDDPGPYEELDGRRYVQADSAGEFTVGALAARREINGKTEYALGIVVMLKPTSPVS